MLKQHLDLTYLYIPLPISLLVLLIFWIKLPNDGTYPKFNIVLIFFGVIAGLMWTKVLIAILIDILVTVEIILNLTAAYMGFTVLAMGNGLTDAMTTITLFRQGAGTLALSGAYAG